MLVSFDLVRREIVSRGALFHFGRPHKNSFNLSRNRMARASDHSCVFLKETFLEREYKLRINTTLQNFNEGRVAAWAKGSGKSVPWEGVPRVRYAST
jgi:hypothetical protein